MCVTLCDGLYNESVYEQKKNCVEDMNTIDI